MRRRWLGGVIPVALGAAVMMTAPALAAAPDGEGPWADSSCSPTRAFGPTVRRCCPHGAISAALGVAERPADPADAPAGTYFSLGFGGEVQLGFETGSATRPATTDIDSWRPHSEPYADELVDVYVSQDGSELRSWQRAASTRTRVSSCPSAWRTPRTSS